MLKKKIIQATLLTGFESQIMQLVVLCYRMREQPFHPAPQGMAVAKITVLGFGLV